MYKMMTITKDKTVAEVVASFVGSDAIFSKYKIDFCCGGGDSMATVSKNKGLLFEDLKNEIESLSVTISGDASLNDMEISELLNKAKESYLHFFSESIEILVPLASKVADVHGQSHAELMEINTLFKSVSFVLLEMVQNSTSKLIPFIEEFGDTKIKLSASNRQEFEKIIHTNEVSEKLLKDSFEEIDKLSKSYFIPEDACNSYRFLYQELEKLKHQFQKYVHLERNLLIPKFLKIIA
jgi:regulator of cell morphogenesis and NO signaling